MKSHKRLVCYLLINRPSFKEKKLLNISSYGKKSPLFHKNSSSIWRDRNMASGQGAWLDLGERPKKSCWNKKSTSGLYKKFTLNLRLCKTSFFLLSTSRQSFQVYLTSSFLRCNTYAVVYCLALLHNYRICAGSNHACGESDVCVGQCSRLWNNAERLSSVNLSAKTIHHNHMLIWSEIKLTLDLLICCRIYKTTDNL